MQRILPQTPVAFLPWTECPRELSLPPITSVDGNGLSTEAGNGLSTEALPLTPAMFDCNVFATGETRPEAKSTGWIGEVARALCTLGLRGGATGAFTLPSELICSSSTTLMVGSPLIVPAAH